MASEQEQESKIVQFPPDPKAYRILAKIGSGGSAEVYKAECIPMDSTVVAIKTINLDQSRADFDSLRRETKTMSLLSHPNILQSHCSYTDDRNLCVVMPFMSVGSLQSIISSAFPDGLPETCIAIFLKETLNALSYLHNQGHLHRDIKAGNILLDPDGHVKLADFGVSASIYEPNADQGSGSSSSSYSHRLMLTDVAGTPYWMAPEVIHPHNGYSFKADIWSFGITALELAYGCPPLSHLPPSKSLLMKITKRFRFSDYEKHERKDKFSKAFKDMVASCLNQDPSKRPTADKLKKHRFFKNGKGLEFLVKNVLQGLPSIEDRFKENEAINQVSTTTGNEGEDDEVEADSGGQNVKVRRLSGWNFNEEGFELDPVFRAEQPSEDIVVKKVRFAGEVIIHDQKDESEESAGLGGSGDSEQSNQSPPTRAEVEPDCGNVSGNTAILTTGTFDMDFVRRSLYTLVIGVDQQAEQIRQALSLSADEMVRGNELRRENERLRVELEDLRRRISESESEIFWLSRASDGEKILRPSSPSLQW